MNASSHQRETSLYRAMALSAPELSREQEADLMRRYREAGDRRAENQLAAAAQRTVVTLALKLRGYRVPLGELVAEGNLGVVQALRRFRPEHGVRFSTYAAYWIRAQMLAHVVKSWSAVGGSGGSLRTQMFFRLRRERARTFGRLGSGSHAEAELAERLGLSPERLAGMLRRLDDRDVSLDGDPGSLLEVLSAPEDQEHAFVESELALRRKAALGDAVQQLDPRERRIIEEHVMADSEEARSLADIARSLRVSRERARQLELRALGKLRRLVGESARLLVA